MIFTIETIRVYTVRCYVYLFPVENLLIYAVMLNIITPAHVRYVKLSLCMFSLKKTKKLGQMHNCQQKKSKCCVWTKLFCLYIVLMSTMDSVHCIDEHRGLGTLY